MGKWMCSDVGVCCANLRLSIGVFDMLIAVSNMEVGLEVESSLLGDADGTNLE
jgi:hypothetical protein